MRTMLRPLIQLFLCFNFFELTFTGQFTHAMIVLVGLVNLLNVDRHQVTDQIVNLLPLRLKRRLVMMVLFLSVMRHIPAMIIIPLSCVAFKD